MIIREARNEEPYYRVPNRIAQDAGLSWAARGMLIYLLSKPGDWCVSITALVNETQYSPKQSGRDAVYALIGELIDAGYVRRLQVNSAGRFDKVDYLVSERPLTGKAEAEPLTGLPDTAEPLTANPTLQTTDSLQTTEGNKRQKAPPALVLPDWLDAELWSEWEQHRKDKRCKLTVRAAAGCIKQLEAYRAQGIDPKAVIEHSIAAGYQGLFAPKTAISQPAQQRNSLSGLDYGKGAGADGRIL